MPFNYSPLFTSEWPISGGNSFLTPWFHSFWFVAPVVPLFWKMRKSVMYPYFWHLLLLFDFYITSLKTYKNESVKLKFVFEMKRLEEKLKRFMNHFNQRHKCCCFWGPKFINFKPWARFLPDNCKYQKWVQKSGVLGCLEHPLHAFL